ncbi:MAG TPA: response regulator [Myxococcota bacterium]|nr:response regulator [Myxococcota bacterium]
MRTRAVRILVLDDDPETLEVYRFILVKEGYDVEVATSPQTGLKLLEKRQFNILLLDLVMPGMSGIEVLEKVREKDKDLAIVVLTGYASVETAVASLKGGVSDYIEKPIDQRKLVETLKKVVEEKGLLCSPEGGLLASIGARLRAGRKQRELTLKQVARRTGLSVSLLSQIERAESAASVASLHKIAAALKIDLQELFEGF